MGLLKQVNWVTAPFLVLTPLVAVTWGGFYIAIFGVYPFEILLFLLYIAATAFSITAGYHRHFAHGAYDCRRLQVGSYSLWRAARKVAILRPGQEVCNES
jgi:fatty-acid desaturase